MNGELIRSEAPLERHLKGCSSCRQAAERLASADAALTDAGGEAPPEQVRASWLELVEQAGVPDRDGPASEEPVERGEEMARREPVASEEPVGPESPPAPEPEQVPVRTIRARARRGGLIGAARRLAASQRRHQ